MLPYLEVKKQGNEEERKEVTMPNITGISIKEAEKVLKELDLKIRIEEEIDKENAIIKEQTPKEGIKINKGSKVIVEY